MDETPRVQVLHVVGCPGTSEAVAEARAAMRALGLPGEPEVVLVEDEAAAWQMRFSGSPTVQVNGQDVLPSGEEPWPVQWG